MADRPNMPTAIRIAAIYLNIRIHGGRLVCEETGDELDVADILASRVHIDHNPALALRDQYEDGTYRPAANNLDYLDVVGAKGHIIRTAHKRGLRRGDLTEIARSRSMRKQLAEHRAIMDAKAGGVQPPPKPLTKLQRKRLWATQIKLKQLGERDD